MFRSKVTVLMCQLFYIFNDSHSNDHNNFETVTTDGAQSELFELQVPPTHFSSYVL
jgi:hypothetical protein